MVMGQENLIPLKQPEKENFDKSDEGRRDLNKFYQVLKKYISQENPEKVISFFRKNTYQENHIFGSFFVKNQEDDDEREKILEIINDVMEKQKELVTEKGKPEDPSVTVEGVNNYLDISIKEISSFMEKVIDEHPAVKENLELKGVIKGLESTIEEQNKVIKNQEAVMKDFSLEKSVNEAIRLHPNFQFLNNIVVLGEPIKKLPAKIPESKKWSAFDYKGTPEEKVTQYLQKHWMNYPVHYSYLKNSKVCGGFCSYLERRNLLSLVPTATELKMKFLLEEGCDNEYI